MRFKISFYEGVLTLAMGRFVPTNKALAKNCVAMFYRQGQFLKDHIYKARCLCLDICGLRKFCEDARNWELQTANIKTPRSTVEFFLRYDLSKTGPASNPFFIVPCILIKVVHYNL